MFLGVTEAPYLSPRIGVFLMSSPHRLRHDLYMAPAIIKDPGYNATASKRTITIDKDGGVCPVVTTGTGDTRILRRPTKAGILGTIVLYEDGGDLTLTVTGGYNEDADTAIVFDDAGDFVTFISIDVGGTYYWRVLGHEGTDVIGEDLWVDQALMTTATIGTLTLGATAITATGSEINAQCDASAQDKMSPSTVIDATAEQYLSCVKTVGGVTKTTILIDLTNLKSVATDKDIIGDTGVCHFGQIISSINGVIFCGQMTCLEVPAGGADDIDLYMASVGTGAYDADGSALTNAASLITKGGAWAVTTPSAATAMTAPVTANYYLYLLSGEAAAGTYTAGKFLIELWGIVSA